MSDRADRDEYSPAGWRLSAACAGKDYRLWFAAPNIDPLAAAVAARVCASCPVQRDCAAEADRLRCAGEPLYGTWAGHFYSQ
jgi:hypothetical protein